MASANAHLHTFLLYVNTHEYKKTISLLLALLCYQCKLYGFNHKILLTFCRRSRQLCEAVCLNTVIIPAQLAQNFKLEHGPEEYCIVKL